MGVTAQSARRFTRAGHAADSPAESMYVGWYRNFLLMFAALIIAVIAGALFDSRLTTEQRLVVISTVSAMVLWFWFYGQWHMIRSDSHAILYLLGNVIGITICIRIWESSALLLFAIYWFGFAYLYTRYAVLYAFVLTMSTQWAFGSLGSNIGFNLETLLAAGLLILLLAFSAMMARYIEAFQMEAERNKALVAELKRTQQTLVEREREAGIEQERRRMAGEIHDTIAQHFVSIITNLRAASEMEGRDSSLSRKHLNHAFSAAQQGIIDSRAMLSTMQPDVLLGRSLTDMLETMTAEWSEHASVDARFEATGQPTQLTRTQESLLVRGLQEALRNIAKHAQADAVRVTLSWLEDTVLLDVSDNGIGFDPDATAAGKDGYHLGLMTMQSRMEGAGGTFALESVPGEGASITLSFPTGGNA